MKNVWCTVSALKAELETARLRELMWQGTAYRLAALLPEAERDAVFDRQREAAEQRELEFPTKDVVDWFVADLKGEHG